ncbi:MAG: hypothetical protein PHG63_03615 [Candidatus Dojkabacteria bacterium]|nr:hypothetical protein [Candidatus Dojkabacteria bacterium]
MTLTEAANITHKGIRFFIVPISLIMVIWLFLGLMRPDPDLPDKYITPDYMCGPLPEIKIPAIAEGSGGNFSIETTSGAIPDLPKVVNVFRYEHPGQSLLALQEAQHTADLLGFEPEEYTRISATEYQWKIPEKKQTLVIETSNQNISLTTDFTSGPVDTHANTLPSEENAKTTAMQYLQTNSLLYKDYSNGTQRTYLIQITADGEMREAPSLSEAQLVRVDFFRNRDLMTIVPDLIGTEEVGSTLQEELEDEKVSSLQTEDSGIIEVKKYAASIYNESPMFGNITVYVGGSVRTNSDYEIFGIEHRNWFLETLACGTYRLITPQQAVSKVQNGEASLVHLLEKRADRIVPYEETSVEQMTILEVTLGYWEPQDKQNYLQPIFIIRGEADFGSDVYGDFYYYVPAIDYESIPPDAGVVKPAEDQTEAE